MLNIRQKVFIKRYLETNSATQAAYEAYGCKNRNTAAVTGYRLLRNVNVANAIQDILTEAGLTPDSIAEKLKKTIYLGMGKRATTKDSIRGLEFALKLGGYTS